MGKLQTEKKNRMKKKTKKFVGQHCHIGQSHGRRRRNSNMFKFVSKFNVISTGVAYPIYGIDV